MKATCSNCDLFCEYGGEKSATCRLARVDFEKEINAAVRPVVRPQKVAKVSKEVFVSILMRIEVKA